MRREYVALGTTKHSCGLMIDWHLERAIVRANTKLVEGIALEEIPPGPSHYCPGMVLIKRNWRNIYFLKERTGWIDKEYFEYAEKRIKSLAIKNP